SGGRGSSETALRSGLILCAFRPNPRRPASSDLALLARVKGNIVFFADIANTKKSRAISAHKPLSRLGPGPDGGGTKRANCQTSLETRIVGERAQDESKTSDDEWKVVVARYLCGAEHRRGGCVEGGGGQRSSRGQTCYPFHPLPVTGAPLNEAAMDSERVVRSYCRPFSNGATHHIVRSPFPAVHQADDRDDRDSVRLSMLNRASACHPEHDNRSPFNAQLEHATPPSALVAAATLARRQPQ
uniref:Uncharacterized protein n=1 Tax=Plectus sambesii TaxID=2011161 RepID=A0A914UTD3_9BILA